MLDSSVHRAFRADFFNSIDIDFEETPSATLAEKKRIPSNDDEGFAECNESIGGAVAILQSYRGGGSVTDGSRNFRTYHAEAIWQLKSGEFVRIGGDVTDRRSQEEILAAIRTVEFVQRSAVQPNGKKQINLFLVSIRLLGAFALPLLAYLGVAAFGAFKFLRGRWRSWRVTQPARYRVYLAAYLALVFTPSLLTDLFLFSVPAPALLGFFALIPSVLFVEAWPGVGYAIAVLYVIPILVGFGIFYLGLTLYARFRSRRAARPPV